MYLNLIYRVNEISNNYRLTVTLDVFKFLNHSYYLIYFLRLTVTLDVFKFFFNIA